MTLGALLARAVCLGALVLPTAGCIVLHDSSGVPLTDAQVAAIVPGTTTRSEALERLGPPTGLYSTSLRSIVTGAGSPIEAPASLPRVDEDVLTWQAVDVDARVAFFPVLFAWVGGTVTDRTLTLFFDEHGIVQYAAWREGNR
ncbi:MAG: hypothetical protein ACYTG2_07320 [Planctomycetota bacterium]|jgi:hypothetical protein